MAVHLCLKDDMCNKLHGPLAMYIVLVNSVTMLDLPVLHFNRKKRRDGPNDRLFTSLTDMSYCMRITPYIRAVKA